MKRLFALLSCGSVIFGFCVPFCHADLKPDELFSVMRASKSRYFSIEATMKIEGFYPAEEKQENPVLMYSQETLYRRLSDLVYAECVTKTFSQTGGIQKDSKEIMFINPERAQYFREEPIGDKHAYGEVQKDWGFSKWISLTPDVIFWYILATPGFEDELLSYIRQVPDKTDAAYDEVTQFYSFDFPSGTYEGAARFHYTVDPSKGYLPTIQEWFTGDKTLLQKNVCGDYRQVNGLWAPFRYSIYLPNGNLVTDVTVKSLSINQPIAPEKFSFEFPSGTHVIDEILGVSYTVDAKAPAINGSSAANDVNVTGTQPAPPATDVELSQSALKAQELIAGEQQAASQAAPAVIPIEVAPSYVWVLDGKNDYTLTVTSPDGTIPTLVSHSFDGGGLILQAVENQLSAKGQMTVTLERPADMEAYADGVLTLAFSGQTAAVHFIAAPAEKP